MQHSKKNTVSVLVIQNPVIAFCVGTGKLVELGEGSVRGTEHLHTPVGIAEVWSSSQALLWVFFLPNLLLKSSFSILSHLNTHLLTKEGFCSEGQKKAVVRWGRTGRHARDWLRTKRGASRKGARSRWEWDQRGISWPGNLQQQGWCELSDVENGLQHTRAEKQWNRQH